jgi:glucose-1-phosphatase
VYFDFSYFYNCLSEREKKLNPNKFRRFIINHELDLKLTTGRIQPKDLFRKLKRKFDLKTGYNDFIYFYSDIFWVNPNMKKFVEKISRIKKYRLYLLSNTDAPHFNFILKNFPFVRILKNRVLSYKVHMHKPQKKIFVHTLEKYGLLPHETVLIDDMKENAAAAQALGMKTIVYRNHKKFTSEFSKIVKGEL